MASKSAKDRVNALFKKRKGSPIKETPNSHLVNGRFSSLLFSDMAHGLWQVLCFNLLARVFVPKNHFTPSPFLCYEFFVALLLVIGNLLDCSNESSLKNLRCCPNSPKADKCNEVPAALLKQAIRTISWLWFSAMDSSKLMLLLLCVSAKVKNIAAVGSTVQSNEALVALANVSALGNNDEMFVFQLLIVSSKECKLQ